MTYASTALLPPLPADDKIRKLPSEMLPPELFEEIGYRFPVGRVGLEMVPSHGGAFGLRLGWHRPKNIVPIFETTPLRPLGEVTLGGQTFPLFFTQHGRQKRGRIRLAGKRKTAKPAQCALRYVTTVSGREDKLLWQWRIAASRAAMAQKFPDDAPPDRVTLFLPLAPGRARLLLPPGTRAGETPTVAAVWVNDLVVTAAPYVEWEGGNAAPVLELDAKGFRLTLSGACLEGAGVTLGWETWVSAARTEADALNALLEHSAHRADAAQVPLFRTGDFLTSLVQTAQTALMDEARVEKKGADRLWFRAAPGDKNIHIAGDGADTALTAHALVTRFLLTGDDALRRRARLLAQGIAEFQISDEESPHWGAVRDVCIKRKTFGDANGEATVGVRAAARAARGLHLLHAHFKTDSFHRNALNATQWLLLKTDKMGRLSFGRFGSSGPPVGEENGWHISDTLSALVETFRATQNEVFQKAALRAAHALAEDLTAGTLRYEQATTEQLSAAIEGVLGISREYERPELLALAQRLGKSLRARRLPDGTFTEPDGVPSSSPLAPPLSAARAALGLMRVDEAPVWPLMVLRALQAAQSLHDSAPAQATLADWGNLCSLPTSLLLALSARIENCTPNFNDVSIKRGWHTFAPEAAARDYLTVCASLPDAENASNEKTVPVDFLPLVCPLTLQVLLLVLAPGGTKIVTITKNGSVPYVKNLLTGDYDRTAALVPIGDGNEAMMGIFLADT